MSDSLRPHELYCPWNSPGQNTEVGSLSLLQGIFPTQGSNPGFPYCRRILYHLRHQGSPLDHDDFIYYDIFRIGEHTEYMGVAIGRSVNLVMGVEFPVQPEKKQIK